MRIPFRSSCRPWARLRAGCSQSLSRAWPTLAAAMSVSRSLSFVQAEQRSSASVSSCPCAFVQSYSLLQSPHGLPPISRMQSDSLGVRPGFLPGGLCPPSSTHAAQTVNSPGAVHGVYFFRTSVRTLQNAVSPVYFAAYFVSYFCRTVLSGVLPFVLFVAQSVRVYSCLYLFRSSAVLCVGASLQELGAS